MCPYCGYPADEKACPRCGQSQPNETNGGSWYPFVLLMILLGMAAVLGGCSMFGPKTPHHELAQTSDDDPLWVLNDGKWDGGENALIRPEGRRK